MYKIYNEENHQILIEETKDLDKLKISVLFIY